LISTPIQLQTKTVSERTTIEMLDALEAAFTGAVRALELLPAADRGKALSGARGPRRRARTHPFSRIEEL
jgi:hypothetical protein